MALFAMHLRLQRRKKVSAVPELAVAANGSPCSVIKVSEVSGFASGVLARISRWKTTDFTDLTDHRRSDGLPSGDRRLISRCGHKSLAAYR
jgi:hypothetical protein